MINYFVSAENTSYFHWQLELLIESFKLLNLQDSLTIALAENDQPSYVDYTKNIKSHKNIFVHKNTPYNRIYSLYTALLQNIIQTPLVILHPDTILVKPFEQQNYDVVFQMDMDFLPTNEPIIKEIQTIKNIDDLWLYLGDTIFMQNIPLNFFRRTLELAHFFNNEKLAWAITLLEYYGHLSYNGTFDFENIMLDPELKFLIHYKHGLPPFFNKHMFYFKPPNVLGMGNPFDILLQHNPNVVTNYMQTIVRSYTKINTVNKIYPTIPVVQVI